MGIGLYEDGLPTPGYLITMGKRVKTGGNNMRKLYIPLVSSAPRASKVAPQQPHLATTIASPSTTLAPTPRSQRLTTVDGRCDTITQPFLIQAFLCLGVSVTQKTHRWQNLVFWARN
jgi:hypothetical protein